MLAQKKINYIKQKLILSHKTGMPEFQWDKHVLSIFGLGNPIMSKPSGKVAQFKNECDSPLLIKIC